MPPVSFTDEELALLSALASPLPPSERAGFLRLVASMLEAHPLQARGPGLTHRLAVEAQRDILKGRGFVAVGGGVKNGRSPRRGRYG
jgi:hypothetical protein